MSGETVTRRVEWMGLVEDEHRSGICGAQCMRVRACVFMICCEILWNFESH